MSIVEWARRAAALLVVATVSGCAMPYATPAIEEVGESTASSFDGILDYAAQDDLRVVWLHGMCTHKTSWANTRQKILAQALGVVPQDDRPEQGRSRPYRVIFNHRVANHDLELRYLVWSPLADGPKGPVIWSQGDPPDMTLTRASLNRTLQNTLINDCFSDAVIYGGPAGDSIRDWLRSEVCIALGGEMRGAKTCEIDDDAPRKKTIFVAESLGSKMLADALISIWNFTPSKEQVRQRLGNVQMVFYLANQIPLLSAATYGADARATEIKAFSTTPGTNEDDLINLLAAAKAGDAKSFGPPSDPVRFVAFSDPNDLLSYRLLKGSYVPSQVRVTNIFVSNDTTYFGVLERPDYAHCGYGWNPAVIGTLARGYRGRVEKIDVKVPHECGFGEKGEED